MEEINGLRETLCINKHSGILFPPNSIEACKEIYINIYILY